MALPAKFRRLAIHKESPMNIIETPQKGKRLVTTVHQSRLPLCLPNPEIK